MLVGALRGRAWHRARMVIGFVLLVAAVVAACIALLSLRRASVETVLVVTVFGGAALTLGFAVAPLIASATDPLDPRRFALLGIPPRPLAGALALAGLISVPVLAVAALGVCLVVVWAAHGVPAAVAAVSVLLAVITCALLARVCTALAAMFLRDRRSRELTGVFVLGILVVVVPVGVFLASLQWGGAVPPQLDDAAGILADTPFGAAWAIPARIAAGGASVWLSTTIAVITPLLLGLAWMWAVGRMLSTTERPVSSRERTGLGWFSVAPGTAGGAIAARSMMYWLRDRRYLVNLLIVPIAAILAMAPLLVVGVPFAVVILVPVPILALFLGWLPHNDIAYDSTAVWMHVASGVRGVSDRLGRLVPILVIGVPALAVTVPLVISLHGRWAVLPAMVGVCAALFFGGLGLSSIASVVAPYPVSRPGESPFMQPERVGATPAASQALVLVGALVIAAPALWWGWLALSVDIGYALAAMWAGIGLGLLALVVGIAIGAAQFERRGTRIMEFAESA